METLDVNYNDIGTRCLSNKNTGVCCVNRTRRVSLDHGRHGPSVDVNGNMKRRSSVCLTTSSATSRHTAGPKARTLPNRRTSEVTQISRELENCLLKQVQGLMCTTKLPMALMEELRNELNNLSIQEDNWSGQRLQVRRKSHANIVGGNSIHPSLTADEHGHACDISTNDNILRYTRRRQSFANIEHFTRMPASRSRSTSIVHSHSEHMQYLDHFRRLNGTQEGHVPERRASCTRRTSHVITRTTSVQKRLYKIYRQRRRKGHRHALQKEEIHVALKAHMNYNYTEDDHDKTLSVLEPAPNDEPGTEVTNNIAIRVNDIVLSENDMYQKGNDVDVSKENSDVSTDNEDSGEEQVHQYKPHRRCSIQARSWEISRRLRQRRREKRKELKITIV